MLGYTPPPAFYLLVGRVAERQSFFDLRLLVLVSRVLPEAR
jgi:hypothetical protein